MDANITANRRRLFARKVKNGAAVFLSASPAVKSRDAEYAYSPSRYLYYLTGFAEPHAALLLDIENGIIVHEEILCRPRNPQHEQWEGERLGPERAKRQLGFANSGDIGDFRTRLAKLVAKHATVYFIPGDNAELDTLLCQTAAKRRLQSRAGAGHLRALCDASLHLDEMRMVKDKTEIALMKHAARISSDGMRAAMRAAMKAKAEHHIEAALGAAFREAGAQHAFLPIVAAGGNACTLHYVKNNAKVRAGDLVLSDIGAEWECYAGDISRTYPARGKFSPAQAAVYDVVLAAQKKAIAAARAGVRWESVENAAARVLCKGLVELGICRGTAQSVHAKQTYRRFYMHKIGHSIGLDVHDTGQMTEPNGSSRRLRAGMVMTIEPGLYIPGDKNVPTQYRGIGVRIEDMVLIRNGGCDVLTDAPKTRADIESWMRG